MASRRVRIKGIANIPQRKKPVINETESEEQNNVDRSKLQEQTEQPNLSLPQDTHGNPSDITDEVTTVTSTSESEHREIIQSNDIKNENIPELGIVDGSLTADNKNEDTPKDNQANHINYPDVNILDVGHNLAENHTSQVPNVRRKFLKPPVRINVVNRKTKENIEVKTEPNKENVQECTNVNLNEVEITSSNVNSSVIIQKAEHQIEPIVPLLIATPKIALKDSTKSGSDTEYQHPPPSPTKILNRRIKAIPKLHQRRTSFSIGSASESEDDSRRSFSRIRNDSVCSVASGVNECQAANEAISHTRKEFPTVQRKCRKTEQTRKFAEARREFNMKFNNGKPDKQKLTMIDLIFYNPATNPMSYNKRKRKSTMSSEVSETKSFKDGKQDDEKVDDPQPLSESDNEIPAPQIKVGPNGEIVVDEKSLVIENIETKRSREALQMSEVVNGDEDTSYGVYKRIKRSKDWSKEETLRFYRALNTIGTDFTMMCELFKNRTRRELKMKFKKEERLNQALIDRTLMQPTEFDITDLRRELELEERKAEETRKRAEETKILRATLNEQKKNIKRNEKIKGIQRNPEHFARKISIKRDQPTKKRKKTAYEALKSGIKGILSDSDDDLQGSPTDAQHEDSDLENEDRTDVSNILKPTRYGRVPKTRVQDTSNNVDRGNTKKQKMSNDDDDDNSPTGNLEPGSIMIVKSKTSSDKVMYKVYIVTDNQTKQQISLEPNILQNLTGMNFDNGESENRNCDIEAHNIFTISAQECPAEERTNSSESNNLDQINSISSVDFEYPILPENTPNFSNQINEIKIAGDSIIFPFDECLTPPAPNQNITVSHEDNKMIVVTEGNKKCVLTT